eukprot:625266_1
MAMVNIGGDANDASYRYKMPRLVTRIEGRGNGIRTLIVNMVDVAKALHCPPSYTTKFFGIDLGALSKYDLKTERSIVNGAHETRDMAVALNKFIEMYILCPKCKLPETNLQALGGESISASCAACGFSGQVGGVARLSKFINNEQKKESGGGKSKKDKRARREAKERSRAAKSESKAEAKSEERKEVQEEIVWLTDTSKEAAQKRRDEEMKTMGFGQSLTSAEAQKTKKGTKASPTEILREMIATDLPVKDITEEMRRLELARGFDKTKRMKILLESVFDDMEDFKAMVEQAKKHSTLLLKYAQADGGAEIMIGCLEEIVGILQPKLLKKSGILLHTLYDADVLEEEQLVKWYDSAPESSLFVDRDTGREIRESCSEFIEWLREADEESGEDDDE